MKLTHLLLAAALLLALPFLGRAQTTYGTETISDHLVDQLDLNHAQRSMIHQIRVQERGNILATWQNQHLDDDERDEQVRNERVSAAVEVNEVLYPDQRLLLQEWSYRYEYNDTVTTEESTTTYSSDSKDMRGRNMGE